MAYGCGDGNQTDPAPGPYGNDMVQFRIMTYNIGACTKYSSPESGVEMISNIIKSVGDTQFVTLNEVDSCTTRSNGIDEAKAIGDAVGFGHHFTPTFPFMNGLYGIGLLYSPHFKLVATYSILLDKEDGNEVRGLSVAEFENLVIATSHLDHISVNANFHQAQQATRWLKEKYSSSRKPVFWCGDFNAHPDAPVISELKKDWTFISDTGIYTHPTANPTACIDYILVLKNGAKYETVKAGVLANDDTKKASDHYPVWARVKILKQL